MRRRQQIIAAATAAFARHGYAGASLRMIAEAVGVTAPALLRHFDSKDALLAAVLDQWIANYDGLIDQDNAEGLQWFLQIPDVMRYHEAHPGLIEFYLTLCGEASDPHHPARAWIAARSEETISTGRGHLGRARADGAVRPMTDQQVDLEVRAFHAMMNGLELQWICSRAFDLAATFEALLVDIIARWVGPADSRKCEDIGAATLQSAGTGQRPALELPVRL